MNKKVLFVGDNHISTKTPENRTDNYLEASLSELQDCLDIADKYNVDAVVLLGDLFDRREEGPEARNGALNILSKERKYPVYITVGNHDIQSSYPLNQTSLGTLIEAGVLIKEDYVPELGIAFAHFYPELDADINNGLLTGTPAVIWSCHASILDIKEFYEGHAVMFDSAPLHPTTSIVVAGHIHRPMRMERNDGKLFINPGAVGRRSANKDNLTRDIKVLLLEYNLEGKILNEEYLPLPSSKPYTEVFNLEKIELKKEQKKEAKEFLKNINQIRTTNWSYTVLEDKLEALKKMANSKNLSNDIIDVVVSAVKYVNTDDSNKPGEFEL